MIALLANYLGTKEPVESTDKDIAATGLEESSNGAKQADDVVTELVDRLNSGEVSHEKVRILREHLAPSRSRGVEVKLDHLRSTVIDLEAYTEALRGFIDEEGTAGDVLEDLRGDIRETDEALAELSGSVDRLEGDSEALDARIDDLHEAVLSLSAYVVDLEERHSHRIDGIDAEVERLDTSVSAEIDEMQGKIADLEQLSEQMRSLDSVSAEIDQMQADLEDLDTFRSNFKKAVTPPSAASTSD